MIPAGDVATKTGHVEITPTSIPAEDTIDLEVEYTATTALAMRATGVGVTKYEDGKSTYGRIQITLPKGWGPQGYTDDGGDPGVVDNMATTDIDEETDIIYTQPQSGEEAYLSTEESSSVRLAVGTDGDLEGPRPDRNPVALTATRNVTLNGNGTDIATDTGWVIWVDVDEMARWQYVTLTVNNLQAPVLKEIRSDRYGDLKERDGKETFEIEILSNYYLLKESCSDSDQDSLPARDY